MNDEGLSFREPFADCRGGGGGNRTHVRGRTGQSIYKLRLRFGFARRPVRSRPTDGLAILWMSRLGRLALPRRRARFLTPLPEPRAEFGATRHLTRLGGECEFRIRTCVCFPVVLRGRPGTSACSSAGESTTSKPGRPRMSSLIVASLSSLAAARRVIQRHPPARTPPGVGAGLSHRRPPCHAGGKRRRLHTRAAGRPWIAPAGPPEARPR